MKKTVLIILAVSILSISATLLSFAAVQNIRVILNGDVLYMDVPPVMINNRVLIPIRAISESLGASITWNQENYTVNVDTTFNNRIDLLEKGFETSSPFECVEMYANAVKNRNGAIQYALMTDTQKKRSYNELNGLHWRTGVSSPWITKYSITQEDATKYRIIFDLATSSGSAGSQITIVYVENVSGVYKISSIYN